MGVFVEMLHLCYTYQKVKSCKSMILQLFLVPRTGIEPARLAAHAPETCASTYSATWASIKWCKGRYFL